MDGRLTVRGLDQTLRKLKDRPTWVSEPLRQFFDRWGMRGERVAKGNYERGGSRSWIDTASTRRSVTHQTDPASWPTWARFGSNLDTARWGDFGTGRLSEDPESSKQRHWPPSHALDDWARRHGIEGGGYVVARAIGLRGGLAPRRQIRDAAEDANSRLGTYVGQLAKDIERAASSGTV